MRMIQPKTAFVLAAGEGRRMRPLTDDKPKPLVEIAGQPVLAHILDHLKAEGVERVIINAYYKAEVLKQWIAEHPRSHMKIIYVEEKDLLDTGGGLVNIFQQGLLKEDEPFWMINGDAFWINPEGQRSLTDLRKAWDGGTQDILLLLEAKNQMRLTASNGDYEFENGKPRRTGDGSGSHMFTGVRLVHPRIIEGRPLEAFSFLKMMDEAEKKGRLAAIDHKGNWHHISTPADVRSVEKHILTKGYVLT